MKIHRLGVVSMMLMGAACAVAQVRAPLVSFPAPPAPIPAVLASGRNIFLANGGSDSGLFPSPFSGDPNRGYDEMFAGMMGMGYHLVSDPSQADLVLEIRLMAPYGPKNADKSRGSADPEPSFRLKIYDRRSHYLLWALTEPIELAFLQKTHDRNFDDALSALLMDFQVLNHPAAPAGKP